MEMVRRIQLTTEPEQTLQVPYPMGILGLKVEGGNPVLYIRCDPQKKDTHTLKIGCIETGGEIPANHKRYLDTLVLPAAMTRHFFYVE